MPELHPQVALVAVFFVVAEPVYLLHGERMMLHSELFAGYVVAIDVDAVDVGANRHERVALVADGCGKQYVAIAVAQQFTLQNHVAFGQFELDVANILAVEDGEAAFAIGAE